MKPAQGLRGPALSGSEHEIEIPMPSCIKIQNDNDKNELQEFITMIVVNSNINALNQLKDLLGDQIPELIEHFRNRLKL